MNVFACTNCNCVSNPCDHPPRFFEPIFVVITEYSFLSDSIPEKQNQRTQWGYHCDSLKVLPPQKFMLRSDYEVPWLGLRIIAKYLVFWNKRNCIQRRHVTTWLSLPADRVVFLLQITSLVLTYRVVNLPSQWSNLEFVCFDDAFFSRKKKKGPFPEQIIVQ